MNGVAARFLRSGYLASVRTHMNRYEKGKIEDYFTGKAKEFIDSLGGSADSFSSRAFIMGSPPRKRPISRSITATNSSSRRFKGPKAQISFPGLLKAKPS
jgi:hypothetical protein